MAKREYPRDGSTYFCKDPNSPNFGKYVVVDSTKTVIDERGVGQLVVIRGFVRSDIPMDLFLSCYSYIDPMENSS